MENVEFDQISHTQRNQHFQFINLQNPKKIFSILKQPNGTKQIKELKR
jgi:hypothetical protein